MTDKEAPVMFGYGVDINQQCIHSEREDEQFGSWSASYTNSLADWAIKSGVDVVSTLDIQPGETAYVVWAEWSSGDSFGWGSRECVEPIGIFRNYAVAKELADALTKHADGYDRRYSPDRKAAYKVQTSDGQVFESGWAPWLGYFEALDEMRIDAVKIV